MKSTREKIEIMTAFEEGKDIDIIHKEDFETSRHNKSNVKDLLWDWMRYDYKIVEPLVSGNINKWVNVMSNGGIRNGKLHDSYGCAQLNTHSEDIRTAVQVRVTYEEIR